MGNYKRITDDEIFEAIKAIENDEEQSLGNALKTLLLAMVDTRQFIRKMYKNSTNSIYGKISTKVYRTPTENSKDIIVGGTQ